MLWNRSSEISHIFYCSHDQGLCSFGRARTARGDEFYNPDMVSVMVERFRLSVRIKNQAIVRLERDGEIVCDPFEHTAPINSEDHSRGFKRGDLLRTMF